MRRRAKRSRNLAKITNFSEKTSSSTKNIPPAFCKYNVPVAQLKYTQKAFSISLLFRKFKHANAQESEEIPQVPNAQNQHSIPNFRTSKRESFAFSKSSIYDNHSLKLSTPKFQNYNSNKNKKPPLNCFKRGYLFLVFSEKGSSATVTNVGGCAILFGYVFQN